MILQVEPTTPFSAPLCHYSHCHIAPLTCPFTTAEALVLLNTSLFLALHSSVTYKAPPISYWYSVGNVPFWIRLMIAARIYSMLMSPSLRFD